MAIHDESSHTRLSTPTMGNRRDGNPPGGNEKSLLR